MINVIFNGASGRMGSALVPLLQKSELINLVAQTARCDDLGAAIQQHNPDCVIDFTIPSCVFENAKIIIENNARPIIGTSGLNDAQITSLRQMCADKQLGGLIVANFSISAILMQEFSNIAAKWFHDVEITERHHKQKLDAPSGTAISTAKSICAANKDIAKSNQEYGVAIQSQRLDNIFAEQDVTFSNQSESLCIAQKSTARAGMIDGVILACQQVMQLNKLEIGLAKFLL
jgi:4-hydroxy-tetrahydrodipicolinate reductase